MTAPALTFPPVEISIKLAISVGIGLLVGLEREWSQKDLGIRTFTIAAMLGTLSVLSAPGFAYVSFGGILLIVLLSGWRSIHEAKAVETTTFAAVMLTFVLGVLVGQGHHYTPVPITPRFRFNRTRPRRNCRTRRLVAEQSLASLSQRNHQRIPRHLSH